MTDYNVTGETLTLSNGVLCYYEGTMAEESEAKGECLCHPPFTESDCGTPFTYWLPTVHTLAYLGLVLMSVVLLWTLLKLAHLVKTGKFSMNLSVVSICLSLVAILLKFVALGIGFGNNSFSLKWSSPSSFDAYSIILNFCTVFPLVLWMAAHSLVVGFWFELLTRKINRSYANRVRLVCILGAALMLVCILGVALYGSLTLLGSFLVLVPLVINTLGLIIITILISCFPTKNMSEKNKIKKAYAVKCFTFISVMWIIYTIATLLFTSSTGWVLLLGSFLHRFCEFFGALLVLLLTDRSGGVFRLMSWALCGKKLTKNNFTRSTSTSPSASGSKGQTKQTHGSSTTSSTKSVDSHLESVETHEVDDHTSTPTPASLSTSSLGSSASSLESSLGSSSSITDTSSTYSSDSSGGGSVSGSSSAYYSTTETESK
eukprot:TRINITY_DN178_c0_g1_i2.p1 TRINITY_DN178_c0_g1~~TRINITY_DN178_c0_g1_i2.p1  ORF type:complete len:431 (+),score=77.76 TRINITY_DN178_c0_g1_i2:181-1473(+)